LNNSQIIFNPSALELYENSYRVRSDQQLDRRKNADVFQRFRPIAKPVRNALTQLGFSEPIAPQVKAIPPILKKENVLNIGESLWQSRRDLRKGLRFLGHFL